MKIKIEFETNKDLDTQIQEIIRFFNKGNQQKLNENNDSKKVLCQDCKKDIYSLYTNDEAKKVISYSNDKLGKALCRDCQKKHWDNRGDAE